MTETTARPLQNPTDTPTPSARRGRGLPLLLLAGLVLAVVLALGVYWFQPQKLVVEDRVDEALPAAVTAGAATAPVPDAAAPSTAQSAGATPATTGAAGVPATTAPAGPTEIGRGGFVSLEHETTGTAIVFAAADGFRLLRLEELATSNGPDLRVILSAAPVSGDFTVWGEDYVELGKLKGNIGSQNYEIPADVDLAKYGRVVIWCDRFDVGFGVADVYS